MFDQADDELKIRRILEVRQRDVSREQMQKFEGYVAEIFTAFGLDLHTSSTEETPRRFLHALFDATEGYDGDPNLLKVFDTECRVNLAGGLTKYGPPDELTLAEWDKELNNNLRSAFLCTRAVWSTMKQQGSGKILNFSRAGGVQSSGPMMLAYNCAKAGIDALTYTFARAGKEIGIAVNAIGPGLITTQSNIDAMKPSQEEMRAKWVSLEHIVEAAIFLVSSAGDGVNGVILPVQGKGI